MYKKFVLKKRDNSKFRTRVEKFELRLKILKYLSKNSNVGDVDFRVYFMYLLKTFNKRSILRINNYCIYTGRNKGLVRFTKMSKIFMKLAVRDNKIVGIRKAVW